MNMLKLLSLAATFLVAANSYGQGSGPTKEQTIEYIQSKYTGGIEYRVSQGFDNGSFFLHAGGDIKDLTVSITGSKVEFKYHLTTWSNMSSINGTTSRTIDKDEFTTVRFDMKDIESIEGGVFNSWPTSFGWVEYAKADEGGGALYLVFQTQNDKKMISVSKNAVPENVSKVWVPFDIDMANTDHRAMHELKDTQLYKAFEHLRKQSGAPEPIRF
jgi:hypothetical protein